MNTKFDLLIFDLDGTLVETREDLAISVNVALASEGLPVLPMETVVRFVGDGALKLVQRSVGEGFPDSIYESVLGAFLSHYQDHCTDHCECYPGVEATLEQLEPLRLSVLTNKPIGPTTRILDHLKLSSCFDQVIGGDHELGRKPDPAGLISLIESAGASPARTLLVGDTSVDVLTARNAGCNVAGVQFGFRPGDFAEHPPDYLLDAFPGLIDILLKSDEPG